VFAGEDGGRALGGGVVADAGGRGRERRVSLPDTVEPEDVVAQLDGVAGEGDDAFDEAGAVLGGETDDDVAAGGVGPAGEAGEGEGHAQVVGEFVDDDDVAGQDGRLHRSGGDVVDVGEGGLGGGDEEKRQGERADPVAPEIDGETAEAGAGGCGETGGEAADATGHGGEKALRRRGGEAADDERRGGGDGRRVFVCFREVRGDSRRHARQVSARRVSAVVR
jgi:hypothetical protein